MSFALFGGPPAVCDRSINSLMATAALDAGVPCAETDVLDPDSVNTPIAVASNAKVTAPRTAGLFTDIEFLLGLHLSYRPVKQRAACVASLPNPDFSHSDVSGDGNSRLCVSRM